MVTINELLEDATAKKASDLHLTVGVPPKVRILGELVDLDYPVLTPDDMHELAYSILPESRVLHFEEQGDIDFSYSIRGVGRYRVNVYHQRGSLAATIRLVAEKIPAADSLGIPKAVQNLVTKKRGLVLVTGPTGSGKSTTLASLIDIINTNYSYNIITIEDPVEYLHKHKKSIVNQREMGIDTVSYSKALVASLREDPDVILIGEMRDMDTIQTAITAAETGHLVFSTLHTIGAAPTIDRIIDVFPPYQQTQIRSQLAVVLEGIISQQLVTTLDNSARKAAFEVLLTTPAVRNLIRESKTHQLSSVMQTNKRIGMQTMDDALYDMYIKGQIDKEHAISYAQDAVSLGNRLF